MQSNIVVDFEIGLDEPQLRNGGRYLVPLNDNGGYDQETYHHQDGLSSFIEKGGRNLLNYPDVQGRMSRAVFHSDETRGGAESQQQQQQQTSTTTSSNNSLTHFSFSLPGSRSSATVRRQTGPRVQGRDHRPNTEPRTGVEENVQDSSSIFASDVRGTGESLKRSVLPEPPNLARIKKMKRSSLLLAEPTSLPHPARMRKSGRQDRCRRHHGVDISDHLRQIMKKQLLWRANPDTTDQGLIGETPFIKPSRLTDDKEPPIPCDADSPWSWHSNSVTGYPYLQI